MEMTNYSGYLILNKHLSDESIEEIKNIHIDTTTIGFVDALTMGGIGEIEKILDIKVEDGIVYYINISTKNDNIKWINNWFEKLTPILNKYTCVIIHGKLCVTIGHKHLGIITITDNKFYIPST